MTIEMILLLSAGVVLIGALSLIAMVIKHQAAMIRELNSRLMARDLTEFQRAEVIHKRSQKTNGDASKEPDLAKVVKYRDSVLGIKV